MTIHVTAFRQIDGGEEHSYLNVYENGTFRGTLKDLQDPKRVLGIFETGGAKVLNLLEAATTMPGPIEQAHEESTDV